MKGVQNAHVKDTWANKQMNGRNGREGKGEWMNVPKLQRAARYIAGESHLHFSREIQAGEIWFKVFFRWVAISGLLTWSISWSLHPVSAWPCCLLGREFGGFSMQTVTSVTGRPGTPNLLLYEKMHIHSLFILCTWMFLIFRRIFLCMCVSTTAWIIDRNHTIKLNGLLFLASGSFAHSLNHKAYMGLVIRAFSARQTQVHMRLVSNHLQQPKNGSTGKNFGNPSFPV